MGPAERDGLEALGVPAERLYSDLHSLACARPNEVGLELGDHGQTAALTHCSLCATHAVCGIASSHEAEQWLQTLNDAEWQSIISAIVLLERKGPALGRPVVDSIRGSRHANMKELRSIGGHLRALFAFDPNRKALILLGGDKRGDWSRWYEQNIPRADDLYDDYLDYLKEQP